MRYRQNNIYQESNNLAHRYIPHNLKFNQLELFKYWRLKLILETINNEQEAFILNLDHDKS